MELRPGFKQTEVGAFPEGWEITELGKLFSFKNGVNAEKHAYGAGIRFINVLEAISYSHLRGEEVTGRVTLPDSVVDTYAVKHGDVLFNRTSETDSELALAATYIGVEKVVFGGFVIRGRPLGKQLDPFYCGYALRAPVLRSQIIQMGQGAVRANIGQESLSRVLAPVPPLAEQRAIATALSDVDALIAGLEKLIAKKRDLKQAAMQQLLTGQTRLPGFSGAWEVKTLGSVLQFQVGFPFGSEHFNDKSQGLRLVKNRDLKADDQIVYYSGRYESSYLVNDGDVLIGMDGDFMPCKWKQGQALLNQRVGRLRALAGIDLIFAYYFLMAPLKDIEAETSATTVKHLSHGDIEGIVGALPPVAEQTAIATVLSDMDVELAALESRLAKTRALKQGMMQELLTGRTRLV
ncbi:hypothetical protein THUN1379_24590 [Paludibacterium sp. THUN1379]|uniref:restriction endonuclease subunit S n=1 Tax=Paludibacterium sp. THUN1379 TaxID=3112107 RepID=UPI003086A368|nr:hypothetical protein THUN1379_24590 [Paludibacterium sp. THUN1379]